MAHVILFQDNPPNNLGTDKDPLYINYQSRAAGAYAIASKLRRSGYQVKVVEHASNLSFAGVKKIIQDNSSNLLWVGIGTTFFYFKGAGLEKYRQEWATTDQLYFNNSVINFTELYGAQDFFKGATELIWGSNQINQIANWCYEEYKIPLLVGGSWITSIANGNLENLEKNVHLVSGRSEIYALTVTDLLSKDLNNELPLFVNNDSFDNIEFKQYGYEWTDDDYVESNEWLPIEISRGCAFNCAFCNYDRKSSFDNYKNPETIRNELIKNYEKYGVTKYILTDDLYNDSKEKVHRLYDKVWSKLPFKPEWTSYMRLDMFWSDPESIEIVKASGARVGSFGIETLHRKAGAKVGKGLGRERIIETLSNLKKSWRDDVIVAAFFMSGLPDEPEESILDTQKWIQNTNLLDSVKWAPMWITPPMHKKFVLKTHQIADDNKKYGIDWISDNNWINKQGMTFSRANELAELGNSRYPIGGFGHYVELRQLGWSHEKILQYIRQNNSEEFLLDYNSSKNIAVENIKQRVKKHLNI